MRRRTTQRPALVAGVFSVLFTSHAFALNRFFPTPPNDDLDSNTIDYNIGTFTNVIVGYQPSSDPADANNTPFPYATPYATTLNIVDGGSVNTRMEVFNGSTVNVSGGYVQEIDPSYNPNTEQAILTDGAFVNISGGTVDQVFDYSAGDTLNLSGGSVPDGIISLNGGTINVTGGTTSYVTATNGTAVTVSDGEVDNLAVVGQASTGVVESGAIVYQAAVGTNAQSDTGGTLTLNGGAAVTSVSASGTGTFNMNASIDTGGATVSDNATLNITGNSSVGQDITVSGSGTVNFGATTVLGNLTMTGGTANGNGGAKFNGGVSLSGSSVATLNNTEIGQAVTVSGPCSLVLNGCSVDNGQGVTAVSSTSGGLVTITGASVISGECIAVNNGSISISGGIINGDLYASGAGVISISAGIVNGTAQAYLNGTIAYSGGVITGGITQNDLLGPADSTDDLTGSLNLESTGGKILIYGTNLDATLINKKFDGGAYSEYALTGTLADGTEVEGATFLVENSSGGTYQLLPPVPEPTGLAIFAALTSALPLRRRR